MKKFILGLILMLFAFSTLPVQAHAPDDGQKKEVFKSQDLKFVNVLEVSIEVPQFPLEKPSTYKEVGKWNYSLQNTPADLNIVNFSKSKVNSWRFIDKSKPNLITSNNKGKNLHIDPGSFFSL